MSFSAAEDNLHAAARHGTDASLYWPGMGEVPAPELVLRRLLPLAHQGLAAAGMDDVWHESLRRMTGQYMELMHMNAPPRHTPGRWTDPAGAPSISRRGPAPVWVRGLGSGTEGFSGGRQYCSILLALMSSRIPMILL